MNTPANPRHPGNSGGFSLKGQCAIGADADTVEPARLRIQADESLAFAMEQPTHHRPPVLEMARGQPHWHTRARCELRRRASRLIHLQWLDRAVELTRIEVANRVRIIGKQPARRRAVSGCTRRHTPAGENDLGPVSPQLRRRLAHKTCIKLITCRAPIRLVDRNHRLPVRTQRIAPEKNVGQGSSAQMIERALCRNDWNDIRMSGSGGQAKETRGDERRALSGSPDRYHEKSIARLRTCTVLRVLKAGCWLRKGLPRPPCNTMRSNWNFASKCRAKSQRTPRESVL